MYLPVALFTFSKGGRADIGYTPSIQGCQFIHIHERDVITQDFIIFHEIFHSLGRTHEHQRPDRDQYVRIHWENLKPGMYTQTVHVAH